MKRIILALRLLVSAMALSAQGTDYFTWSGDTLRLDAPAEAAVSACSWPSDVSNNAVWRMTARLDFAPSGSNFARWYLMSSSDSLRAAESAYYVRLGYSSRRAELCRQEGGKTSVLASSAAGAVEAGVPLAVEVSRRGALWTLCLPAAGWDTTVLSKGGCGSVAWGVECTYTKTRSRGFTFCDFHVDGEPCEPLPDPAFRQIRITEALTDPETGGADYVEVRNVSADDFETGGLSLSNGRSVKRLPDDTLRAGEYRVFTRDSAWVTDRFGRCDPTAVRLFPAMPALTAASGRIVLYNALDETVDSLVYDTSLLGALVAEPKGVAYELDEAGGEAVGPASCQEGCGSPGRPNAYRLAVEEAAAGPVEEVKVVTRVPRTGEPVRFVLSFRESALLHAAVYALDGERLRVLYANELLSGAAAAEWDTMDENGRSVPPGVYVLYCEAVGESGRLASEKIPFVLSPAR